MLLTLKLNGVTISYTQEELIALGQEIASGDLKYNEIYNWIVFHIIER